MGVDNYPRKDTIINNNNDIFCIMAALHDFRKEMIFIILLYTVP